jgi:hypothetical protein
MSKKKYIWRKFSVPFKTEIWPDKSTKPWDWNFLSRYTKADNDLAMNLS